MPTRSSDLAKGLRRLGVVILIAPMLWAPLVFVFWKLKGVDPDGARPFLLSFVGWDMAVGAGVFALASVTTRYPGKRWADGLTVAVTCTLLFLADRLLLAFVGVPYWSPDPRLIYRMRPHTRAECRTSGDCRWATNSYGFFDTEFPVQKPAGEIRVLVLGDSVTMAYRLAPGESYPHRLEVALNPQGHSSPPVKIINTAVEGYATDQESVMLEESLRFQPDFVILGFCLNDVTEPFVIDLRLGGIGIRYGQVVQFKIPVLSYLVNETGFGQAMLNLPGVRASMDRREQRSIDESLNPSSIAGLKREDPRAKRGWDLTLGSLDRITATTRERNIPFLMLIFPFDFQFFDESRKEPQRILLNYCRTRGIDCLNMVDVFEKEILNPAHPAKIGDFFFDPDHLTHRGHEVVAQTVKAYLLHRGWLARP